MKTKEQVMKELQEYTEWIQNNMNPYTRIEITDMDVRIMEISECKHSNLHWKVVSDKD